MPHMDSDKIAPPDPYTKAKEYSVACDHKTGEYYYIVTLDQTDLPYLLEGETVIVEYRRRRAVNNYVDRLFDAAEENAFMMDDEVAYAGA